MRRDYWVGEQFFFLRHVTCLTHKQMMFARFMCSVLSTRCWLSPKCANLQRENMKSVIFVSFTSLLHAENHYQPLVLIDFDWFWVVKIGNYDFLWGNNQNYQLKSERYGCNLGETMNIRHGWTKGGKAVCSEALHNHLRMICILLSGPVTPAAHTSQSSLWNRLSSRLAK